jgi:hypothetical protein
MAGKLDSSQNDKEILKPLRRYLVFSREHLSETFNRRERRNRFEASRSSANASRVVDEVAFLEN